MENPELDLRASIPVFVNSFNQKTYLAATIDWLATFGFMNVVVLENQSNSAELTAYFQTEDFRSKARLCDLGDNIGPRRAMIRAYQGLGPNAPFIFTDPDLELPAPPAPDFLTRMFALGRKYKCPKVGLALDVSQPERFKNTEMVYRGRRFRIEQWEQRYWNREVEPGVYLASVDTTFFLHVPMRPPEASLATYGKRQAKVPALRIASDGFLAKHKPWYADDGQTRAERDHYIDHASDVASWARLEKEQP